MAIWSKILEIDDLFLDEYKVRYSQDKVPLVEKDAYIMDGIVGWLQGYCWTANIYSGFMEVWVRR